ARHPWAELRGQELAAGRRHAVPAAGPGGQGHGPDAAGISGAGLAGNRGKPWGAGDGLRIADSSLRAERSNDPISVRAEEGSSLSRARLEAQATPSTRSDYVLAAQGERVWGLQNQLRKTLVIPAKAGIHLARCKWSPAR